MAVGWVIVVLWQGTSLWTAGVGVLLANIATWLWRRPEPRTDGP
jgi:hypothetical protein